MLADKAYATNAFVGEIRQTGAAVVVPSKRCRRTAWPLHRNFYAERSKAERFFNRRMWYRRQATRYEKSAASFLAFAYQTAICDCLL